MRNSSVFTREFSRGDSLGIRFLVELCCVCAMTVPEYLGDRIFTLRYSHDVNMIGYVAIGDDSQPKLESIVAEQFPVPKMICFIEEHIEAAHATLSNMMRKSWTDNPSHSRHKHHNDDPRGIIAPKGKGRELLWFEGERVGKRFQSRGWLCEGTSPLPQILGIGASSS